MVSLAYQIFNKIDDLHRGAQKFFIGDVQNTESYEKETVMTMTKTTNIMGWTTTLQYQLKNLLELVFDYKVSPLTNKKQTAQSYSAPLKSFSPFPSVVQWGVLLVHRDIN